MGTNHEDTHINESILSEEILEDQKKNRIDHMTYLPGMEDIGSEILDQVVAAMRRSRRENILVTVSICSHQSISQIIARTIAFTVVLIAITKSTVHS